jgi:hypothetical protein
LSSQECLALPEAVLAKVRALPQVQSAKPLRF